MEENKQYIQEVRDLELRASKQEQERASKLKTEAIQHAEFIRAQMTKPTPLGSEAHLVKKF